MIIKDSFKLIRGTPNILNFSGSVVRSYYNEENSPRHIFVFLELKKNSLTHFTNKKIFQLISDKTKRDSIQVINFDYILASSYNPPTKGMIINLKPFEVRQISNMSPNDLYSALVYTYCFEKMVTKKFSISESYAQIIINFLLSLFVKAFGRKFGLLGIYSSGIPKLKFLTACYILSSFFGYQTGKKLFMKATSLAPYLYSNEIDQLMKYDFSDITQFITALSDLKVTPGLSISNFTSTMNRYYSVEWLAALEDCSRFFSVVAASSVPSSRVAPRNLIKVNEKEYFRLVDVIRRLF